MGRLQDRTDRELRIRGYAENTRKSYIGASQGRAVAQAAAAAQPEDRQRQSAEQRERYVVHLDHLGHLGAQAVFPSRDP